MDKILAVARFSFLETLRNKIYNTIILFGFLMLGVGTLLGVLAVEEEVRLIFDLGLGAIELFALITAAFGAVTMILEEMDSRALYLIITRPLARSQYLLGRSAGLWASVGLSIFVMAAGHLALLLLKGWVWDPRYLLAVGLIFGKVVLISSLAVFFSLFSSSPMSAVVFTFFFWTAGHFGPELKFLAEKAESVLVSAMVQFVFLLVPNLQFFNLRDAWNTPGISWEAWVIRPAVYGLCYTGACLAFAAFLFRKKEF